MPLEGWLIDAEAHMPTVSLNQIRRRVGYGSAIKLHVQRLMLPPTNAFTARSQRDRFRKEGSVAVDGATEGPTLVAGLCPRRHVRGPAPVARPFVQVRTRVARACRAEPHARRADHGKV